MKTLYFTDIDDLCCNIADKYDAHADYFADISVIAKYSEANEIIKSLLCMGYDIASINLNRGEFEDYWDEYIISLNSDGVWCEKFKRDNRYLNEDSNITYISNECNSACIPYVKSKEVYAFEIGENEDDNITDSYYKADIVTGTLKDNDAATITVKCNLDADEAMKIIRDMEIHMNHINDIFEKMDMFHKRCPW